MIRKKYFMVKQRKKFKISENVWSKSRLKFCGQRPKGLEFRARGANAAPLHPMLTKLSLDFGELQNALVALTCGHQT